MLWNVEADQEAQFGPEVQYLEGKRIVMVGNGGSIGATIAGLLAGFGARIFFSAGSSEELGATLSAIAQARGEGEGMIVDLSSPAQVQKFFKRAERQLGQVDVLIDILQLEPEMMASEDLCIFLAARHMRGHGQGRILSVGVHPSGRGSLATLRRELKGSGVRFTRIEPELGGFASPDELYPISAEDLARCIYESLVQPFSVDLVFMKGQSSGQLL